MVSPANTLVPADISPSTAKLSTAVTAVSIVVVVPFTVKLPLKVRSAPVAPAAKVLAMLAVPVRGPVKLPAVTFPVTF